MTGFLTALAAACLFVVFGILQRGRDAQHRCATCPSRHSDAPCPLTDCHEGTTPEARPDDRASPRLHRSAS